MESFAERFIKILADQGSITNQDADSIIKDFKSRSQESLVYFLVDEGLVQKNQILKALSRYYNLPSFDATGYLFDNDLVGSFPREFLTSNGIIPLSMEQSILTVVAAEPDQAGLASRIMEYMDANVEFVVGIKRDIWDAIQEFYYTSVTDTDFVEKEENAEDESIVDEI